MLTFIDNKIKKIIQAFYGFIIKIEALLMLKWYYNMKLDK